MEEYLWKADIVVYGRETERFDAGDDTFPDRKDSTFQVFCVMKNDNEASPIPATITLEMVEPLNSCQGTHYNLNEDIILALTRTESGNFQWHELNVTPDGAAYEATEENLNRAIWVCGLIEQQEPEGRTADDGLPHCPPRPEIHRECVTCSQTSTAIDCENNDNGSDSNTGGGDSDNNGGGDSNKGSFLDIKWMNIILSISIFSVLYQKINY